MAPIGRQDGAAVLVGTGREDVRATAAEDEARGEDIAEARGCAGFDENERAGAERPGSDKERLGLLGRQLREDVAEDDEIGGALREIAGKVSGELCGITERCRGCVPRKSIAEGEKRLVAVSLCDGSDPREGF